MHVRFMQGGTIIADIPEWEGPIPREGDHIFHPPMDARDHPADGRFTNIAGHVASVTWFMYERPRGVKHVDAFVPTKHPYVEIHFPS